MRPILCKRRFLEINDKRQVENKALYGRKRNFELNMTVSLIVLKKKIVIRVMLTFTTQSDKYDIYKQKSFFKKNASRKDWNFRSSQLPVFSLR